MPDDGVPSRPDVVGWETTLACNMRCRHCGSTAGEARGSELDSEQAMALCRQIIDLGAPRAGLTGGETLMRRDWRRIVDTLLNAGLDVGLLTNGWLLTKRVPRDLRHYVGSKLSLAVSIDGLAAEHDEIRDVRGSFTRAFDGARRLLDSGMWVDVITTINPANLDSMPQLRRQILDRLRPMSWQIQTTTPFGRAREHDDMSLSHVEYTRAATFVMQTRRMAEGRPTRIFAGDCLGYLSQLEPALRDSPWPGCGAGRHVLGVRSNGDVIGCLSIVDDRFLEGNVLEEDLATIWQRPGGFAYTRDFTPSLLEGLCADCEAGEQCRGGCTANAVAVFDTPHQAPYCLRRLEAACGLNDQSVVHDDVLIAMGSA